MEKQIIANWKMNKNALEADSFLSNLSLTPGIDVKIAPPSVLLPTMRDHAERLGITLGAQNMSEHVKGSYTGEISALMLKDAGAKFVILGHSERRNLYHENNDVIAKKVECAVVEGLPFILCVGGKERDTQESRKVVKHQLQTALASLTARNMRGSMIAYEPVWAIGSGKIAKPEEIEAVACAIQEEVQHLFDGEEIPILYGGSVNEENIEEILTVDGIGGTLVGGASLDVQKFMQMIKTTGEYS